jgi:hypothetical protein
MKFTNQFSNTTPCQSDVAADAWEDLCAYDEAKRERIDEIVGHCIDNKDDWDIVLPDIFETDEIESLLAYVISQKTDSKGLFNKLVEIIHYIVEEDFEYYDRNITGDSLT